MGLPTGLTPAGIPCLNLSQGGMGARCSILGVYLGKVARSSSIQHYLQYIEVYSSRAVTIVVHTYNIELFTSKVKRFSKKHSTNFLHNSPAFGCDKRKRFFMFEWFVCVGYIPK